MAKKDLLGGSLWEHYSHKVAEKMDNPKNRGEITQDEANALGAKLVVADWGAESCGDAVRLYWAVDEKSGKIVKAKFKSFGCGTAIASSDMMAELCIGKTLQEAVKITNIDVEKSLRDSPEIPAVPPQKMHCSVMGQEALEVAIAMFRGGPSVVQHGHGHEEQEGEIVCKCFGLTDGFLKKVIAQNRLHTAEQVTHFTKAGGACGGCIPKIKELIAEVLGEQVTEERKKPEKLTNLRKMQLIKDVLEKDVRPQLWADGGDLELIDIDGGKVQIAFRKACAGCVSSGYTARFVEQKLRDLVSDDITVEEVEA